MRSQNPKTFTVQGVTYTVIPYNVDYGMELLEDLLVVAGEPLARLIGKLGPMLKSEKKVTAQELLAMDLQVSDEQISAVMMPLLRQLGGGKLNALFKRILEGVQPMGSSSPANADYDTRFMGQYGVLFKVVALTLGAQYGSFLADLGGLAKSAGSTGRAQ